LFIDDDSRQVVGERTYGCDRVSNQGLDSAHAMFEQRGEINFGGRNLDVTGLDLRQGKNRIDQHKQMLPAREDLLQILEMPGGQLLWRLTHDDPREADDRV